MLLGPEVEEFYEGVESGTAHFWEGHSIKLMELKHDPHEHCQVPHKFWLTLKYVMQ